MAGLTKRIIETACRTAETETRLWHDDPRGLGIRIKPSGVATFFVQFTSPVTGRKVRQTIGQFGRLTIPEAVVLAREALTEVARGGDPALEKKRAMAAAKLKARTMAELCDQYMDDARAGLVTYRGRPKKARTLASDVGRVERHIKPVLGQRLVQDIGPRDVEAFFHAIRRGETAVEKRGDRPRGMIRVTGGITTASRTVDLLGSIFSYAVRHELRGDNPVAGFERPPTRKRDRTLSPAEYIALGQALDAFEAEGRNPVAIAAIRALALTGCRRSEILELECSRIDSHRQVLRFADSKSGQQLRPVGRAAIAHLEKARTDFAERRRYLDEGKERISPYLFPAATGGGPLVGVKLFAQVVERAGLAEVTLHTLRHSYASTALDLGYSELTIAGLLGHRLHSVTSRYAHHVDRALVGTADQVAGRIARDLAGGETPEANVVHLQQTGSRQ